MSKMKYNPFTGEMDYVANDADITASENLSADRLVLSAGNNNVKPMEAGEDGSVVTMSDGKPKWVKPLHQIAVENVEALPTDELYEGRAVSYQGRVYVLHDGCWQSMADDLGGKPETHEEEFVFQPTAGDLSIKDGFAEIKKIKGNTLVWNQLADICRAALYNSTIVNKDNEGNFMCTDDARYKVGFNNITSDGSGCVVVGHSYYINMSFDVTDYEEGIDVIDIYACSSKELCVNDLNNTFSYKAIKVADYDRTIILQSRNKSKFDIKLKINVFDLTKMFGEGNEPSTVEEFEAMFPNDYYEYNEGTLISHDSVGIKTVGFNQFDGEKAKVLSGQTYYLGGSYDSLVFKKKASDEGESIHVNADGLYTPSSNGYIYATGSDICINLSHTGYRNGEYQPYEEHTTQWYNGKKISELTSNGEVIFPDGLRRAGNVYDEITFDGKAIKRLGSVDMGDLSWLYQEKYNRFAAKNKLMPYASSANLVTPLYTTNRSPVLGNNIDKTIYISEGNVFTNDFSYTDAALFKASLQGQILYYELAEPVVYTLDTPINMGYEAYDFGTEEMLYSEDVNPQIPVKADIAYNFNAVDMIRNNYFEIKQLQRLVSELRRKLSMIAPEYTSPPSTNEPAS